MAWPLLTFVIALYVPVMIVADMAALEKEVRSIVKDGLLWGSCKSADLSQM